MPLYVTPPPPEPYKSISEAVEAIKTDQYKERHPKTVAWLNSSRNTHD